MITKVDPVSSMYQDLTGNSCIIQTLDNTIYIVSNVRSDNTFVIYKSLDSGTTYTIDHTTTLPTGTKKFDPAVYSDGYDLYFLGSVASSNPTEYDLVFYKYVTSTNTLTQVTLVTGNKSHGGYDINEHAASGAMQVAVSVWQPASDPTVYNGVIAFLLDSNGTILNKGYILGLGDPDSIQTAQTYGGISIVHSDIPNSCDIYYTQHDRVLQYNKDKDIDVNYVTITPYFGSFSVSSVTTVFTSKGRFTDDKLTVQMLSDGSMVLTTAYYTINRQGSLISNAVVGYKNSTELIWKFKYFYGDTVSSWSEPTISVNSAGEIYVALLESNIVNNMMAAFGRLRIYLLNTASMITSEVVGNYSQLNFSSIRGTKSTPDTTSDWFLLGFNYNTVTKLGDIYFVSHRNLPPVVSVTPTVLTLQRGVPQILDASATYDPDLDPMTFDWTHDDVSGQFVLTPMGSKAQIVANKAIGPAAKTITVTLTVTDTPPASIPPNSPVITTVEVDIPLNLAPTVDMPTAGTASIARNVPFTIVPTVSDPESDSLTYQWTQTSGTVVSTSDTQTKNLTVYPYRTNPAGEALVFELAVSDGISAPVTASMTLNVAAIDTSLYDTTKLQTFAPVSNKIALRNTSSISSTAVDVAPITKVNADKYKMMLTQSGDQRRVYSSSKVVLVTDDLSNVGDPTYYKFNIPDAGSVLDGYQAEDDFTFMLVQNDADTFVLQYSSPGYADPGSYSHISDYPDKRINVSAIQLGDFTKMEVVPVYNKRRIIILYGTSGVFLLEVDDQDVSKLYQYMFLSLKTELLDGASSVIFIRYKDLQSVSSGQLLVGTTDENGNTFESLIDLANRRVIKVWDRGNTISQIMYTGEFLFKNPRTYAGPPKPPALLTPTVAGTDVTLLWAQEAYRDVELYEIYLDLDDANAYQLIKTINTGVLLTTIIAGIEVTAHKYSFKMRSKNIDGFSDYSNVVSVGTSLIPSTPQGPYGGMFEVRVF